MDNKNNTKVICYLDGGDVCGFVFVVIGIVVGSGGGGGGGRIHRVNHLTKILIPWPFQPLPPQALVDCGVVEVGGLVVRSNSTAQRHNGLCYLPPPLSRKIRPKSPQKV